MRCTASARTYEQDDRSSTRSTAQEHDFDDYAPLKGTSTRYNRIASPPARQLAIVLLPMLRPMSCHPFEMAARQAQSDQIATVLKSASQRPKEKRDLIRQGLPRPSLCSSSSVYDTVHYIHFTSLATCPRSEARVSSPRRPS